MVSMVYYGIDVCIMEVFLYVMYFGWCKEVDFDVVVFINFIYDFEDFYKLEDEYKEVLGKLFVKMVNLEKYRKIVNIDDF